MSNRRYPLLLTALFAVLWLVLALEPIERRAWLLQNIGIVSAVVLLALSRRRLCLSRVSYTCLFILFCLMEVGAHYTYPRTPYDAWFQALTGESFDAWMGWERNNFDRFVHIAYGLLLAYPVREVFLRVADVRGFWSYFLPLDIVMSTSLVFELVEWMAAEAFAGGDPAFIGTQGDVWDAHKDMAVASLGALIAMSITAAINARYHHDFAREWVESLRVKRKEPVDPDGIAWLASKKK